MPKSGARHAGDRANKDRHCTRRAAGNGPRTMGLRPARAELNTHCTGRYGQHMAVNTTGRGTS